jgi:NTE family protein
MAGCATRLRDEPAFAMAGDQEPGFLAPPDGTRRRTALVLSGGAARGFAHLGMLRVLEREGLKPDLVVGTSAGAVVGAMYASGMSVNEIERAAELLDWTVLFDFDPMRAVLGGLGLGLVPGLRLEQFLRRYLSAPIERFPLAFAAVAADMESGDVVALNHGDAARAVRASCAVPGVYAPVRVGGRLLGDGQIVSPLPVRTARRLGAVRVLALDVVYPPHQSEMSSPVSMLFQSLIVSGWRHVLAERALADLVIVPEIRATSQLGLGSRGWIMDVGEKAAQARITEIRSLFALSDEPGVNLSQERKRP